MEQQGRIVPLLMPVRHWTVQQNAPVFSQNYAKRGKRYHQAAKM